MTSLGERLMPELSQAPYTVLGQHHQGDPLRIKGSAASVAPLATASSFQ